MSNIIKLKITGMTCNHCVMHAKKSLESVTGVESAEVSLDTGSAEVTGTAELNDLIDAVKEAGYSAEKA